MLLRDWLDKAQLRLDDVLGRLTPEHFSSGCIPSRSTISDRLAGVRLDNEFVEAIADLCSGDDAALREQLMEEARLLASRIRAPQSPTVQADPTELANELVAVQRRSLRLQDRLMRAWERAMELDRERSRSHQMVGVLLTMVDKLQRDITTLTSERDRLRESEHRPQRLETVHQQLARSEEQRRIAEAELGRAREERSKADRLAEEAAEQIRSLNEELERLRQGPGQPDNSAPLTTNGASDPRNEDFEAAADDIDDALAKATQHLDDGARRLDRLACELHHDDLPDNSAASTETSDAAEPSDTEQDSEALKVVLRQKLRTMKKGETQFVSLALHESADVIVGSIRILLESENSQEDWNLAYELLHIAAEQGSPSHLSALLAELRSCANGDGYAYELLSAIAANRPTSAVIDTVAALRESCQDADAYQLLSAVGRVGQSCFISPILLRLSSEDATWVIEAVTAERSAEEINMVRAMLALGNHHHYVELLSAPRARKHPLGMPLRQTSLSLVEAL